MDKKTRIKKTVLISGIVLYGICFLYLDQGIFPAIFDRRLSDEKMFRDKCCLQKTQKFLAVFLKKEIVNIKSRWQERRGIFISAHGMGSQAEGGGSTIDFFSRKSI